MTRTQHWLLAISLFISLLLVGVVVSLGLKSQAAPAVSTSTPTQTAASLPSTTTTTSALSEQAITQKVAELLPTQTPEQVQKVNYQGTLAYQVTTASNQLYLDGNTGQVIAVTNRTDIPTLQTAQYSYQGGEGGEYEESGEGEAEHEEGEDDD